VSWAQLSRVDGVAHCSFRYANVAVVWIEYVCKYMNSKEVNMLLKDFLRHVSPNRAYVLFSRPATHPIDLLTNSSSRRYEKCQDQIQGMCLKVCSRFKTFAQLVTMDFFMPVVDLCLGKKKVTVCKVMSRNSVIRFDFDDGAGNARAVRLQLRRDF
jgi:hypothetical protein